jgi:arylformamidase
MTDVFAGYDQDGLDAQYNLRPLVPHHPKIFERYIRDSALVVERYPATLDVAYGDQPGERLDIFHAAASDGRAPIVVFIHGGYWRNKDKSDYRYLAPAFVEAGVSFVPLNYTLAPHASMDEIVRQNRAALAWLSANIADHGGDPDRIHITGHSAGGHLVAMLMATDWMAVAGRPDVIAGASAISGLFDLEPIQKCYLNETLDLDGEEAERNSPVHLTPTQDIPLILSLGGEETIEYHRQQDVFEAAWSEVLSDVSTVEMLGLTHYDVIDHLGHPGSGLYQAVMAQVRGSAS